MLFQIYGENAGFQLLGWALVFVGLIAANELARRSNKGGIFFFLALPAALTVYFIAIYAGAAMGAEWALNNPTSVSYTHLDVYKRQGPERAVHCEQGGDPGDDRKGARKDHQHLQHDE